ncbi:Predicted nucleic acid-binding protein, contains PIN domain [Lentzea waywayandensis]|uniref:Predicted nucleic acid-binding protein, contains PIN domain n=1 Tax=Lentzea waywayandensis TaxID=84724 RepID=A0A1I6F983_9PSEU|nr:Predicted nucleic acid-binding protein, contains PIN domain [Lentzea waywayandensis]
MTRTEPLVLDTMCLSHFALIERLDVLGELLSSRECWTTAIVKGELARGAKDRPLLRNSLDLPWLHVAALDELDEILLFAKWSRLIGTAERDHGEASVFAVSELLGGIALTDDQKATKVARANGLNVHGTIWLLAQLCRDGKITEAGAGNLIDMLRESGMRLPCTGAQFGSFGTKHGLL